MTKDEINRVIHKARGLCWHEEILPFHGLIKTCKHCGYKANVLAGSVVDFGVWNPDYTSREKFLDLWDWARAQLWWWEFGQQHGWLTPSTYDPDSQPVLLLDENCIAQPAFASTIADFLDDRQRKVQQL